MKDHEELRQSGKEIFKSVLAEFLIQDDAISNEERRKISRAYLKKTPEDDERFFRYARFKTLFREIVTESFAEFEQELNLQYEHRYAEKLSKQLELFNQDMVCLNTEREALLRLEKILVHLQIAIAKEFSRHKAENLPEYQDPDSDYQLLHILIQVKSGKIALEQGLEKLKDFLSTQSATDELDRTHTLEDTVHSLGYDFSKDFLQLVKQMEDTSKELHKAYKHWMGRHQEGAFLPDANEMTLEDWLQEAYRVVEMREESARYYAKLVERK